MIVAGIAIFMPWQASITTGVTKAGNQLGIGRGALIISVITLLLISVKWRPAWIGAGLMTATVGRELVETLGDDIIETRVGIWLSFFGALVAASLLIWDLIAGVQAKRA